MTELQRVHLRLSTTLPSRTHYQKPRRRARDHSDNKPQQIKVGSVTYESFRKCWKALRISPLTLTKWLNCGRAERA